MAKKLIPPPAMSRLTQLRLWGNPSITDAGLLHLKNFPNLHSLKLYGKPYLGNDYTDAGLVHLKTLKNLESLELEAKITDSGLAHLHELKNLRKLELSRNKATPEGIEGLRRALPSCSIEQR